MIVFDASALVAAALKANSTPERALLHAEEVDVFVLSTAVAREIVTVLARPKFARAIRRQRREHILEVLSGEAVWFEPAIRMRDCRDPKDWRGVRILRPAEYLTAATSGLIRR